MVTRGNCVLEYTGEQLDESDCDLIMALIAFAQPFLFGNPVLLNRKQLLRAIKSGRIGSSQYDWLRRSMKRLREATLFLEARKREKARARERRKEAGICIQCGKKKAKAGHTRCSACLKKCRERERIKTIRKIVEGKA